MKTQTTDPRERGRKTLTLIPGRILAQGQRWQTRSTSRYSRGGSLGGLVQRRRLERVPCSAVSGAPLGRNKAIGWQSPPDRQHLELLQSQQKRSPASSDTHVSHARFTWTKSTNWVRSERQQEEGWRVVLGGLGYHLGCFSFSLSIC